VLVTQQRPVPGEYSYNEDHGILERETVWSGSWVLNDSRDVTASVFRAVDWGRQFILYPLTKLHGVTTQTIITLIFAVMRKSDLPHDGARMSRRQCS
jgi:hypothetical protein